MMRTIAAVILLLGCLTPLAGADEPWVDPKELQAGQVRRELTRDQTMAIATIQRSLSEVDDLPLEEWLEGFRRDENPDREIAVWKRIAAVYTGVTRDYNVNLDYKREVFKLLVAASMMPREEVPQNTALKILTAREIIGIMDQFYEEK
jgi:hypothetical protein